MASRHGWDTTVRLLRAVPLLALALPAGTACDRGNGSQAQAAPPPPPAVTVATPLVRHLTEYDEFTGRFEAVQQVEIRARVSGYVQQIEFDDGDLVEPGQILFIIDPRPYEAGPTAPRSSSTRPRPSSGWPSSTRHAPRSWSA